LHPEIKLFFDQCLSTRLPRIVLQTYAENFDGQLAATHLSDCFKRDEDDANWVPKLADQSNWIIITADRGKDSKKEKLPVLCSRLGISHIAMTPSFHQAGYLVHKHGILALFPQIVCVPHLPKGTRVTMGFKPHHQRNWPALLIGGFDFDAWCIKNKISLPGLYKN
jgi:hypothetical protein